MNYLLDTNIITAIMKKNEKVKKSKSKPKPKKEKTNPESIEEKSTK